MSEQEEKPDGTSAAGDAEEEEAGGPEPGVGARQSESLGAIVDARPLKQKVGDYPEADERELRMAGVGCIALVTAAALTIGIVFVVAFRSINDLGGGAATATVVSEAPPRESDEERPRETRPELQVGWMEPAEGLDLAAAQNRPVVAFFEAAWANASRDMREGTFEDPSVVEALEDFVPIRVDMASEAPAAIALRNEFEIRFVPHVLFLGADGRELRPGSAGLVAPEDLRVLLSDAREVHRSRPVRPPEASASDAESPPASPATPASGERP